ncbi:MAG: beta strand repeat-containing protein, partial [Bacteroidia bacterium]
MRKITKLFSLLFSFGLFVIQGQNLLKDPTTYDKSKHLIKRSSEIPLERMVKECAFFGGDSLKGFDISSNIKQSIASHSIYRELKSDLFRKEAAFIKQKYNIAQLPFEIPGNEKITSPPNQVMTACSNVDFESGTFAGWTGKVGYNALSTNNITVTSTGISTAGIDADYRSCSYHTLTTAAGGNDFYGNFPTHFPGGGTYSVRLGGENANVYDGEDCNYPTVPYQCHSTAPATTPNAAGERLEQTFTVSATNSLFTFSYAAVLNDGGHSAGHQPYFKIEVLDPSNNPIACFTQRVELVAGVVPPGGVLSSNGNCWFLPHVSNDDIVYYIPWKTNSYNLSAYSGQNVTVRFTAAGCTEGDHFGYAYFDASCGPAEITTSNASPCNGQTVTLTAPSTFAGTYAWSGPGIVGSATGQTVNINAAGTYSVTVGTGPCAYTLTLPVTYGSMAGVTATPTSGSICSGQTTTLTSSAATSYTWTPASSLNNPNIQSPVATPTITTNYTVTVSSGGCTGTATALVTVNSAPTLTLTPAASSICIGNNTTISASGATTYTWTPSGSLSSANGSPVTATPTITTTYVINSTDGNGCTNSNSVTINVNQLPNIVLTPTSSTVCNGSTTSISASGASTYTWTPSATLSSANGTPVTATPTGPVTYTVNGTDLNGCQNSNTVSLGINPNPSILVSAAASSVCPGSTTTLTAGGASTYTWTPSATLSSPNGSPVTAAPSGPVTYTVTGTDLNGCQNTNTVSLTLITPSPVSANAADPVICNGNGTMLFASGASTYTWTPSGSLGNPNGSPVSANPASTTTYTVTGTDSNGCTDTSTVMLTVNQPPVLTAIGDQTVCSGSAVSTISFATTPPGGNINWTNSNTGIGLGVSGNGDINSYTPTVSSQQTGTITATPVDAITACAGAPQTFTITVNPLPVIDTSAMNITNAACTQSNGCISGIVGQAPGTYQYSWDNGTTWSGNSQNCNQPVGTYSLQVQDMTSSCIAQGTYAISNLNPPAVPLILGATTVCAGDSISLSISSPQSGITYTWTDASGTATGSVHTVYTIGPAGTYTVSVTASDINGCVSSASTNLTVSAAPVSTVSGSSHFCAGNNTVL